MAGKQELSPSVSCLSGLPLGCFSAAFWQPPRAPPAPLTSFDMLHFTAAGNGELMRDKRGDSVTGLRGA